MLLAWQKLDELRSLAFTIDDAGQPITDTITDTAAPERAFGGTELSVAGPGAHARHARLRGLSRPRRRVLAVAPSRLVGALPRRWAIEAPDGP